MWGGTSPKHSDRRGAASPPCLAHAFFPTPQQAHCSGAPTRGRGVFTRHGAKREESEESSKYIPVGEQQVASRVGRERAEVRWPSKSGAGLFTHLFTFSSHPSVSTRGSRRLVPPASEAGNVCETPASWQIPGLPARRSVPGPSSAPACIARGGCGSSQALILAGLGLPLASEHLG